MSGPAAFSLLARLTPTPATGWQPGLATLCTLAAADGKAIDRCLVLPFRAPRSYTGEDLVEFHVHGNPVIVAQLLDTLRTFGARLADPGGFTRRAILNGKLGLPEAEALAELIAAVSPEGAAQALARLAGGLRQWATTQRRDIIAALAQLEAHVDFPDEPIEPEAAEAIADKLARIGAAIATQADKAAQARIWTEGARIAIVGAPNAGKSTLLNRLLGEERAIVSPWPGTTRDVIEVGTQLGGIPIQLIDTAGIRTTDDPIEREGVARSLAQAQTADLVVVLAAPDAPFAPPEGWLDVTAACVQVWNKTDIAPAPPECIALSAHTGQGLDALIAAIGAALSPAAETPVVSSLRQEAACRQAAAHLATAAQQLQTGLPLEIAADDVHAAARHLDRLLGTIDPEDVLDELFATFCIGK